MQAPLARSHWGRLGSQSLGPAHGRTQRRGPTSQVPPPQSASLVHSTQRPSRRSQIPSGHSLCSTHSTQVWVVDWQRGRSGLQWLSLVHSAQRPPGSQAGRRGSLQSVSLTHCTHTSSSGLQCVSGCPAHWLCSVQASAQLDSSALQA